MLPFLTQMRLEDPTTDYVELTQKMLKGMENLSNLREEDIDIGITPKEVVYQEDKVILYHYQSDAPKTLDIPLLMVYALVNRPFMVDLQEGRSLVANLLKLGIDVYLIDWGYPSRGDRWLTLDDYLNEYVNNCVDFIRKQHNLEKINLLGICQGGTFSVCYASLYPEKVQNLVIMVAPIDFNQPSCLLNMRGGCTLGSEAVDIDLMVDAMGNVPGDFLNLEFLMLKPQALGVQKYVDFPFDDERNLMFNLRMEKWIFDSPDQAGETYRQFLKDFYQGNKLIKGEVKIGEQTIDLSKVSMPVLNIFADFDHLVHPASSQALKHYISSTDYTEKGFKTGHIGMYVSGKVQADLPPAIADWLTSRSED